MDQGQCPVFEFIPKWPDLGDTLCKNKPKISAQNNFSGCKSGDEYNSSDQYRYIKTDLFMCIILLLNGNFLFSVLQKLAECVNSVIFLL